MRKLKVTELERLTLQEFKTSKKIPLVLILDDIRSMYNVGSIFRTADAFRIQKIILCGITSTPPMKEIHKTALGAEDSIEWIYEKDAVQAVKNLQNNGYKVLAIEQVENSMNLQTWKSENTLYAFVVGNEVKGVQQSVVDVCDGCLEIPQFGTKHSLNVANATAIVIWDFFKQLGL